MNTAPAYRLFTRFGVELEYMIVNARTLRVLPRADRLIRQVSGSVNGDVTRGPLAWSNELALHVIEFKTDAPARCLGPLAAQFQREVQFVNAQLAAQGAMLLPTAMHPWMDPHRESRLWPHDCGEIYRAFHKLFNCRGHGWTNLQSTHLNLPFANNDEFVRLHTAIRLILPLLPALAASSPFIDGVRAPFLDMRLETYRTNCARIPSITAAVVPEPVRSAREYQEKILGRIYRDLAPHDPAGMLQQEWANARGAIARFERNTIEIRVLDIQECPAADLAIVQALVAVLQRLVKGSPAPLAAQLQPRTATLAGLLHQTVRHGGSVRVRSPAVLEALGLPGNSPCTVTEIWRHLLDRSAPARSAWRPWLDRILDQGSLSERILKATGPQPGRERLQSVYRQLATCLDLGIPFQPPPPASRKPRLLLSCEHATNRIPSRFHSVARKAGRILHSHRGYDPGALALARALAQAARSPLASGRCSRLLVELNRSVPHAALWSEFSRDLSAADKAEVMATCYLPHWRIIKGLIQPQLQKGGRLLHLGVHTFTPALNGTVRNADVGLLFDPSRTAEAAFCRAWRDRLAGTSAQWRVRLNYPYRGVSDGLIPRLRAELPATHYLGIELEVNQQFPLKEPARWRVLQRDLARTLMEVFRR